MPNLGTMRSQVSIILGLDNTVGGDQTLVDEWINRGIRDVVRRSQCFLDSYSIALVAGDFHAKFPATIYAIKTIHNTSASQNYRMTPLTLAEIEDLRYQQDSSTAPARHYAISNDFLALWPTPGTGETIKGIYVPSPTTLSASGETPSEIPTDFHDLPELYAQARAAEYINHLPSNNGVLYRGYYEQRLRELKTVIKKMGGPVLPRKTLNAARRLYPPHDPSTDTGW